MSQLQLNAVARADVGKGASRRLRRLADQVPAIIYGGAQEPSNVSIIARELDKALENEKFYSSIITLVVDGQETPVILKSLQRHPARPQVLHADFQRVTDDSRITTRVPLHFSNTETCRGVKIQGGSIDFVGRDVLVRCQAGNLPEYIEVDMQKYIVGQIVHLSDLTLPEGVESVELMKGEDHDQPLANIVAPRGGVKIKLSPEA